ncbi:hypothetical protein Poli38472_003678 [Pythium oligandrum]|uniref:Trehalase n=1 Tax=Pythium oligandrum TaxID=41045 RepID=A0A8K1CN25_PYTOL|nr:hypothetical protein Poli38472_003678 [Pythium oligandrum]|eukprot:TMW65913.1 hypothetical protein Poli38472_003678 [Pythium oligandrum]
MMTPKDSKDAHTEIDGATEATTLLMRSPADAAPYLERAENEPDAMLPARGSRRAKAFAIAAFIMTILACGAVAIAALAGRENDTSVVAAASAASVNEAVHMPATTEQLHNIYLKGDLLDAVHRHKLYPDSKHFVDMPIKANSSPELVLSDFETLKPLLPEEPTSGSTDLLQAFVDSHFDNPDTFLLPVEPADYKDSPFPPEIEGIKDEKYKAWAIHLHKFWKVLGRKPNDQVASTYLHPKNVPELNINGQTVEDTIIVVPGGRFRESYYWDSYWIVEGLMVSDMHITARRVVKNLLEYVAEFGFVPNGGRIYYLDRSQPPLLSDMVRLVTNNKDDWDLEYLRKVVPILEKEYDTWMTTHSTVVTVDKESYTLNRYTSARGAPRPESYREDKLLAEAKFGKHTGVTTEKTMFYNDIAAGAESGWDFSSRWFRDQKTLGSIVTSDILPVDLNAILYRVEKNLQMFHEALGNKKVAETYETVAKRRAEAFKKIFWDEKSNCWRDYFLSTKKQSTVMSAANYIPLWAGLFDASKEEGELNKIVKSLRESGLIQVAGVQTTTRVTSQQWDAPNAWPPLQDLLITGLLKVDTDYSRQLAKELILTWVKTNYETFIETGNMFEKFNGTSLGGVGHGGEYTVQAGFGWTNGVILKFLTKYQAWLS